MRIEFDEKGQWIILMQIFVKLIQQKWSMNDQDEKVDENGQWMSLI